MAIRMDTRGLPIPPIRRASVRVRTADVTTHNGRYLADVPTRHIAQIHHARTEPVTTQVPKAIKRMHKGRARNRFLAILGVGALCCVGIIQAFSWGSATLERFSQQQVYGKSYAVVLETRVGHHDQEHPTLFLGFPKGDRLYLVEIAGGDPQHTQVYPLGHYAGNEEDMLLVLIPRDVNGDGMVDLEVTTSKSQFHTILYNNGKSFQPDEPNEKGEAHEQQ